MVEASGDANLALGRQLFLGLSIAWLKCCSLAAADLEERNQDTGNVEMG
jgi:hypothetical protein